MKLEIIASIFKELGHSTRLNIYRHLIQSGNRGIPVGVLQSRLGIPASTLSHHIASLVSVGIIRQCRDGRILYCVAQYDSINSILKFLTEDCYVKQDKLSL